MQLLTIVIAAAAASALDVRLEHHDNCDTSGGGYVCYGTLITTCCYLPSGTVNSVHFTPVNPDWNINFYAFEHGKCNGLKTSEGHWGVSDVCLSDGPYTGARWDWRGSARRSMGDCTPKLPDHYEDAEGKKYSLAGMSEDEVSEFDAHVDNGTVSEVYSALVM